MWGLGEIITAFLTRHVGQNAYRNNRFTRRWQLWNPIHTTLLKYIQDIHFSTKQPASTEIQSVNHPRSPPVFKFFSFQQIFSSHTFNYFQPCKNKTAFCEWLLYQCRVNLFGDDLLNNRNIKVWFLSSLVKTPAGLVQQKLTMECYTMRKQWLTTQVCV